MNKKIEIMHEINRLYLDANNGYGGIANEKYNNLLDIYEEGGGLDWHELKEWGHLLLSPSRPQKHVETIKMLLKELEELGLEEPEEEREMQTWEEEYYTVAEEDHNGNLHKFVVYQDNEAVWEIYPDDLISQSAVRRDLDNREPIENFYDGNNEEVELKKYIIESVDVKNEEREELLNSYSKKEAQETFDKMQCEDGKMLLLGVIHKGEYELLEDNTF